VRGDMRDRGKEMLKTPRPAARIQHELETRCTQTTPSGKMHRVDSPLLWDRKKTRKGRNKAEIGEKVNGTDSASRRSKKKTGVLWA